VQQDSIISRPFALCSPSISAKSTTGKAILFAVYLTGLQGLQVCWVGSLPKQQP